MKSVQYYCKACGAALGDSKGLTHCLECHTKIGDGRSFCGQCGLNRAQNMCYNICPTCQASFEEQDGQISEEIPLSAPSSPLVSLDYIGTTEKHIISNPTDHPISSPNNTNLPIITNRNVKIIGSLLFGCFLLIGSFLLGHYLGQNKNQTDIDDNPVVIENPDQKAPLDKDEHNIKDDPIKQDEPEKIEPTYKDEQNYLDEMTLSNNRTK